MTTSSKTQQIRRFVLGLLIVALAMIPLGGIAAAAPTQAGAEERFVADINRERTGRGLRPLAVDVQLTGVARGWSNVMAAEDKLRHNPGYAAQISGPWQRVGENVGVIGAAGVAPEELAARLHGTFMASAGHRDNVLGDFDEVGVGVTVTPAGRLWVTVNFAKGSTVPPAGALDEAVAVSRRLFPAPDSADAVIVARADVFADAMAGAGLAGATAPILYTPGPRPGETDPLLHPRTRAELDRVLRPGGKVYLLGGAAAVSDRVWSELAADGYDVRRLAGGTRIQTALRIAEEVVARHGAPGRILLARADVWADAISGGAVAAATRSPLLLTSGAALDPEVAAFLGRHGNSQRVALGGPAALSEAVVKAARAQRVGGADRSATAVAVAERLWGRTSGAAGDRFVATPAWREDGWGSALAHAPWSARHRAPQLLLGDHVTPAVADYLNRLGYGASRRGELDTTGGVAPAAADHLRALLTS